MPILGTTNSGSSSSSAVGVTNAGLPGSPVATNCWSNGFANGIPGIAGGSTTGGTSRTRHAAGVDCADLRLVYGNVVTPGVTVETDGPNTYTIKASVEWDGVIVPATFGGSLTGTCAGGGLLVSDPLPVEFLKGEDIWVRTYVTASGTGVVRGNVAYLTGSASGGFDTSDLTGASAGTVAAAGVDQYHYGPANILGTAVKRVPSIGIIGDSISTAGNTEFGTAGALVGSFIVRALNRAFPYVHFGQGSDTAGRFVAKHRRVSGAGQIKYAICQYGVNDLGASTPLQLETNLLAIWQLLRIRGASVYQTTITPVSSSTDSFATTGNQTPITNTTRSAVNDWIRDGAPIDSTTLAPASTGASSGVLRAGNADHPLSGYFDVADAAEPTRNAGIWKVGYTTDGLHPATAGQVALAAVVNTAAFV